MSRNYSRKDEPTTSDLALIWDSANSDWRLATLKDVVDLYQTENNVLLEKDSQYSTPTANPFSVGVTSNNRDTHFFLQTGSTEGTIVFPLNTGLRDKQELLITSLNEVVTLTLDKNGASAIIGAVTTIPAEGYVKYKYDLVGDAWYRVG